MKKNTSNERNLNVINALARPWALGPLLALALTPSAAVVGALESGAEFLNLDTGARAVAMGSAYTAASDGANSLAYNPAGLASAARPELGFTHTSWLLDTTHDHIAAAMPAGGRVVVGVGYTRLASGGFEGRGADRSAAGGFTARDQAVTLGVGARGGALGYGAAVKYVESAIGGERAAAFAADVGVTRGVGGAVPVTLGLAVRNLGRPMRYLEQEDPLPLTVAAGALVSVIPGFGLALDVKRLVYDRKTVVSVGSEYGLMPGVALRAGYAADGGRAGGTAGGVTLGAGVTVAGTQVDYGLVQAGELGGAQRVTLRRKF